jgi:hypothetical protein
MEEVNVSERVTLAIGGTYHAVLKLLAAARAVTLTELVGELLCDGLCREFASDPRLEGVVRELVLRDEKADPRVQERTLELLVELARLEEQGKDGDG